MLQTDDIEHKWQTFYIMDFYTWGNTNHSKMRENSYGQTNPNQLQAAKALEAALVHGSQWVFPLKNCFRMVGCMLHSPRLGHVIMAFSLVANAFNIPRGWRKSSIMLVEMDSSFQFPGMICQRGFLWWVLWANLFNDSNEHSDMLWQVLGSNVRLAMTRKQQDWRFAPPFCEAFRGSLLSRHLCLTMVVNGG